MAVTRELLAQVDLAQIRRARVASARETRCTGTRDSGRPRGLYFCEEGKLEECEHGCHAALMLARRYPTAG